MSGAGQAERASPVDGAAPARRLPVIGARPLVPPIVSRHWGWADEPAWITSRPAAASPRGPA